MTEEEPPQDLMRYDILTQEALRGVIKKVLDEVVIAGLPGDHHFFITFDTNFPGVRLSKRMHEKYPEAMTIVIQHSFWNLETSDSGFEIDLSFNDIPERLRVPFASVQSFFDPSVKFGLQFDVQVEEDETSEPPAETKIHAVKQNKDKPEAETVSKPEKGEAEKKPKKAKTRKPAKKDKAEKQDDNEKDVAEKDAGKDSGAEVVSLDSFRKKK